MYDCLVIGAGPGGLTAAIYCSRANLKVAVLEKLMPGGQVASTYKIDNYPGVPEVSGVDLALKMFDQATALGVEYLPMEVTGIKKEKDIFLVKTNDQTLKAKTVIVATGTKNRKLHVEGEEKYLGRGISFCAICDGSFYQGQDVLVVGGGNSALEESLYLSSIVKQVYIINITDEPTAFKNVQDKVKKTKNIEVFNNSEVIAFEGDDSLKEVKVKNLKTKEVTSFKVNGCFEYIGHIPNTDFLKDLGILNKYGYIVVDERKETKVKGLFGVGDVIDKEIRQITTATGDGTIAALNAAKYL
ncbi:MAG TPA: thioredoxin-disulfide reductase [Bacilli bacterium]|jgi:thioredoxin reductase (NADPH)|nr:thioredoxin-disulfide reductase [Bacilli bacterium]HPV55433.1 thioredoxin-disulfide reductase [Bacilli bacterium]HQM18344.1 thioredoxin-disulfide reductase [Bacilli bacterium]